MDEDFGVQSLTLWQTGHSVSADTLWTLGLLKGVCDLWVSTHEANEGLNEFNEVWSGIFMAAAHLTSKKFLLFIMLSKKLDL